MKSCETCKTSIDDNGSFCPRCGRLVPPHPSAEVAARVHRMLTEANLHRIRGEYAEAIDKCTEALKLHPDSPEVHSLLGDIYEAQGGLDDAVRWYQMALDLRPGFAVDAAKLERTKSSLEKVKDRSEETTTGNWSQAFLGRSKLDTVLRYIVVFCSVAVLVLLVVGLLAWIVRERGQPAATQVESPASTVATPEQPGQSITTWTAPGATPRSRVVLVRPEAEQQLLSSLATNPAINKRRLLVEDAKLDPRGASLVITFRIVDPVQDITRLHVLRAAATVATAAFAASLETSTVTVRALVEIPGEQNAPEPHIALICEVPKHAGGIDASQATEEQLLQIFTDEWWGLDLGR
jgi:hypothetical protein